MLKNVKIIDEGCGEKFNENLKTVKEMCKILSITKPTLYKRIADGMPYKQIGGVKRFDVGEILKWFDTQKLDGKNAAVGDS